MELLEKEIKKNKLIDIDYFLANQDKIEKIKNKKFSTAIATLLKFQSNDFLLFDLNTQKINNVSQNTAVFFNQALIKDIAKSYDVLENAVGQVLDSDHKDLLVDSPVIFGQEVEYYNNEDTFMLVNKDLKQYFEELDSKFFKEGIHSQFDFFSAVNYNSDDSALSFDIRGYGKLNKNKLLSKSGFFLDKANGITSVKNTKTDEAKDVLVTHGYSFGKNTIRFAKDLTKTRLDLSCRLDYLTNATQLLTGLDMELLAKLTKKAEMFTYGYLTDTDKYISKRSKRSTWRAWNYEYDKDVKSGRRGVDNINTDYQAILNLMQYGVDTKFSVEDFYDKLKNIPMRSSYMQFGIDAMLKNKADSTVSPQPSLETEIAKNNIFLNSLLITINKIDEISLDEFHGDLLEELQHINLFLNKKQSVDKSIDIFNNVQSNAIVNRNENLNIKKINEIIKSFTSSATAGTFDTNVNSYVLNMRDDKFERNDALIELCEIDETINIAIKNLADNKFYDRFVFDKDYIDGKNKGEDKEENRLEFLAFTEALKHLKMPVREKGELMIGKLGREKASGIFSSATNKIVIDTRFGNHFKSVKHEETHRIDISSQLNKVGRNTLVSQLENYFIPRVAEYDNAHYYLEDVELIARAGEIASLLYASNYSEHYKKFNNNKISEQELWDKAKEDFNLSNSRVLMKEFDAYSDSDVYIDFTKASVNGSPEKKLIDNILEYYKPFYSSELTDVLKLASSLSSGFEDRKIEGIKTEGFEKHILNEQDSKLIKPSTMHIDSFSTFEVDFSSVGTKEIVDVLKELKEGVSDISTFKEQVSNGVLDLNNLVLDNEAFYGALQNNDIKSFVKDAFRDKDISYSESLTSLIIRLVKEQPDKAVSLLADNRELLENRLRSTSTLSSLVNYKGEKENFDKLFVEFSKEELSKGELKRIIKVLGKDNEFIPDIISNHIAKNYKKSGFGMNKGLLVESISNGINFNKEQVALMGIEGISEFKKKFLFISSYRDGIFSDNEDIDNIVNKKEVLEKVEQFLQNNNIDYNRGELLYKAFIDENPHGVDNSFIDVSLEEMEVILDSVLSDDKPHARYKADDIEEIIGSFKLENSSHANLFIEVFSRIDDDEIIKHINFESLSRVLAYENKFNDFKNAMNYNFDNKVINEQIEKGAVLYKFLFSNISNAEHKGVEELSFASDILKEPNSAKKTSLFSFYLAGKEERFDICANMLGEFKGVDLPRVGGVVLVLDSELGIDLRKEMLNAPAINNDSKGELEDKLSELGFDNDDFETMVVENTVDEVSKSIERLEKLTNKEKEPEAILRSFFSNKSSVFKDVDSYVSSALTSMSIFSKDIDDNDIYKYTKRDSEALRNFIMFDLPINQELHRQNIVNIADDASFCFGIKDTDELKSVKTAINKELNMFSCISKENMTRSFAKKISKTLSNVSILMNPPKVKDIDFNTLTSHERFGGNDNATIYDLKLSVFHGIINDIQSVNALSPALEMLKSASDKISYHALRKRSPYADEVQLEIESNKLNAGIKVVDGILAQEQFFDCNVLINQNNYKVFSQVLEIQKQHDKENKNSVVVESTDDVIYDAEIPLDESIDEGIDGMQR